MSAVFAETEYNTYPVAIKVVGRLAEDFSMPSMLTYNLECLVAICEKHLGYEMTADFTSYKDALSIESLLIRLANHDWESLGKIAKTWYEVTKRSTYI